MIKYTIQEIIFGLHLFLSWRYKRNAPCASSGLEGITEVDTDPEGRFVSFKVTISNESSLFGPLQGIAPENSWLGGFFLKDYEIICKKKKKLREMKTK